MPLTRRFSYEATMFRSRRYCNEATGGCRRFVNRPSMTSEAVSVGDGLQDGEAHQAGTDHGGPGGKVPLRLCDEDGDRQRQ